MAPQSGAAPTLCLTGRLTDSGECHCFRGYGGESCEYGLIQTHAAFLFAHIIIFCLLFFACMAWAFLNAVTAFRLRKFSKGSFSETPTILIFGLISFGSLCRVVYLAVDPYWSYKIFPQDVEGIIFAFTTWSILGCGVLIAIVWNETYKLFNDGTPTAFLWPLPASLLGLMFIGTVLVDRFHVILSDSFQFILDLTFSIICLGFCFYYLVRATYLYRTLNIVTVNNRKSIMMERIQTITRNVDMVMILLLVSRIIGLAIEWRIGSQSNYLLFQSIYRFLEWVACVTILVLFKTHQHFRHAFCSDRSRAVHFRTHDSTAASLDTRSRSHVSTVNEDCDSGSEHSDEEIGLEDIGATTEVPEDEDDIGLASTNSFSKKLRGDIL